MKRSRHIPGLQSLAILLVTTLLAAAQTIPPPPVEARLDTSKTDPYEKETFTLILEIITRDLEIDPQLDLANLPENTTMEFLGPFEALAVQRERADNQEITRRRYRAQVRALQPGTLSLAPVLQLTARKRVRSFFGSAIELRPVTLQVPARPITIKPIPDPPAGFSGVIGDFEIDISAEPLDIMPGDLVTITTTLRGEGWVREQDIPAVSATPALRSYRVRMAPTTPATKTFVFHQTVVPLERELTAIPAIPFSWFNTRTGSFQQDVFGPFPLQYIERPIQPEALPAAPPAPASNPPVQSGPFLQNRLVLTEATRAHLAPAHTSKSHFSIPPGETVRILERQQDWLLIEHQQNRGWIPTPTQD